MDWSLLVQALGHWAGMVKRSRTLAANVHKQESRRRILDTLRHNPGKNLSAICNELGLRRGTAQYHLYILERVGAVGSSTRGRTLHFFPPHANEADRRGLLALQRERAPEVVHAVVKNPGIVQRELLNKIGMSRKVFRTYARLLVSEGLVEEVKIARNRHYRPTPKLERLWALARGASVKPPVSTRSDAPYAPEGHT